MYVNHGPVPSPKASQTTPDLASHGGENKRAGRVGAGLSATAAAPLGGSGAPRQWLWFRGDCEGCDSGAEVGERFVGPRVGWGDRWWPRR